MLETFAGNRPSVDPSAWVHPSSLLVGQVVLGADASVWPFAVLRGDIAAVRVGRGSNIQDGCVIHVDWDTPCTVGDHCVVGHRAVLHGATVGNGCLVGMGAILLNRCVIGEGSLIGAGSLVPEGKVIPPGSLVVGVPGKVIRAVTPEELLAIRKGVEEYVGFARQYRSDRS